MRKWVGLAVAGAMCWLAAACDVQVQDLGGSVSWVSDVNEFSVAAGASYLPGSTPERPIVNGFTRTFDGVVTHLQPIPGLDYSYPYAINDDGVTVGESARYSEDGPNGTYIVAGTQRAVRWDDEGRATDLGTLGGSSAGAWDINDDGVIVGWSSSAPGTTGRAFVFDPAVGHMTELPLPVGALSSRATAINDAGVAVGSASFPGGLFAPPVSRAVRWDVAAGMVSVLPANTLSEARDINEAGVVAGGKSFSVGSSSGTIAALWSADDGLVVLDAPDGATIPEGTQVSILADQINDDGTVIVSGYHSYWWSADAGAVEFGEGRSYHAVNNSGVFGGAKDNKAVLVFPES